MSSKKNMGAVKRNFGLIVPVLHIADATGSLVSIEKKNPTKYRTLIKKFV